MKAKVFSTLAAVIISLGISVGVSASDPSLSNVPVGKAAEVYAWTVQGPDGGWWTTDCTPALGTAAACRTTRFETEDEVVAWVYRLQQEFWVEYLS